MKSIKISIQNWRSVSSWGISASPLDQEVRVSREFVFDELASWYTIELAPTKGGGSTKAHKRAIERPNYVAAKSQIGEMEGQNA